jgi:protein-S-isoprenylcysteine O-methyltransferase Ste14
MDKEVAEAVRHPFLFAFLFFILTWYHDLSQVATTLNATPIG